MVFGTKRSGKSTTLKMLLGLVRPSGGEIDVFGKRFNSKNRMKILKKYWLADRNALVLRTFKPEKKIWK